MRYVILDTETTGLSAQQGDKMVEIGAIEMVDRQVKPNHFHHYINPQRDIPEQVVRIHGIDNAKVADAPTFNDIADDFLAFIEGATLVIHNASFDLSFIMHGLAELGKPSIGEVQVVDTLEMARKRFPGRKNSLDALCDRFEIARGHRSLHGALLDSELLAEVYLALTGGRQFSLQMDNPARKASSFVRLAGVRSQQRERIETAAITQRAAPPIAEGEQQAHLSMLERIMQESGGSLIWQQPSVDGAGA
ncbi:MAG: DNA polymerase III subunit epsilon [Mariprofundales bacterium]|nr:DNA polymerase III subunit epsilon [Mariprofundales bacterium]